MKARGLVVVVAFALAASATMAIFLYTKGVKEQVTTGGGMTAVIVSEQDIAAGTALDDLIAQGAFAQRAVPNNTVVKGAVTELSDLKGATTASPILAGEQISTSRLQGSNDLPGGTLGIPTGYQAVSVQLDGPRIPGAALTQGDHVQIYATFDNLPAKGSTGAATVTLVEDAQVLKSTGATETGETTAGMITLALTQKEAQEFVFAQEQGSVWLGLKPPGAKSESQPPTNVFRLLP